ncbi:MAG: oxidoreductase domain protein [Verrucomicrobiales bacterium]|nr:oxidoreductase domain protein [Verrucomicrobiales bacterium]
MNPTHRSTARRSFLKAGLAATAAPFLLPSSVWAAESSPNAKIRMAFIGMGKQNGGLLRGFMSNEADVQVMAVCDVDTTRRENAKKVVTDYYTSKGRKETVDSYNDFREVLARTDVDAVCIATPDHWHAIITTAALAAGKDVYCEKPLVHSIEEAVAVMGGTAKHNRILQTGSMQRSSKEFRTACEIVRNGFIGEVKSVICQFGVPGKLCDLPEQPAEPGLDWDRWLGPAPSRPYSSVLSPRGVHDNFPDWRLFSEYGGGYVTDWGAHHLDIAQWALGMDESGPVEVRLPDNKKGLSEGAQLVYANGVTVTHKNAGFGVDITGSEGTVKVNRGKIEVIVKGETLASFTDKSSNTSLDREVAKLDATLLKDPKVKLYRTKNGNHLQDFISSVRSRQKPCTHEIIGARSASVCNLMNIAYTHGTGFGWDPAAMSFKGPGTDAAWLKYSYRGEWKLS